MDRISNKTLRDIMGGFIISLIITGEITKDTDVQELTEMFRAELTLELEDGE